MSMRRQLGEHVEPPLDRARLDRQWHGVLRGVRRGRSRTITTWGAGLLAILAVSFALGVPRGPVSGDRWVAIRGTPIETTLFDGTRITIEEGTLEVAIADERAIELRLVNGAAAFDVEPMAGRRFVVRAGDVEVQVDEAHLRVGTTPLEVQVTRGRPAEVRRAGATVARVAEGQTWRENAGAIAAP